MARVSKRQFEVLDLFFFSLIGALVECINLWAFSRFNGMFYVSFAVVLGLIAMVRWNGFGVVVTIVAGTSSVIYDLIVNGNSSISWILANTVGYLPILINLLWFKGMNKKPQGKDYGYIIGYVITGFLLTEVGRSLCYIGGSTDIQTVLLRYFAYDLINIFIGILIYILACRQKDLVTDMNAYLIRIHKGTEESRVRSEQENYQSLEEMAEADEVSDISLLDGGTLSTDDLRIMNETKKKMEGKKSKYDIENEAIKKYQDSKKKRKFGKSEDSRK